MRDYFLRAFRREGVLEEPLKRRPPAWGTPVVQVRVRVSSTWCAGGTWELKDGYGLGAVWVVCSLGEP